MTEQELEERRIKSTPTSKGLLYGAGLAAALKAGQIALGKAPTNIGKTRQLAASALFGSALGAMVGSQVEKLSSSNTNTKEIEYIMNQDLIRACEMAKYAADMTVPVEQKPAPEVGTDPVPSMTTGSPMESASKAAELAKAREIAAQAAAAVAGMKTAADTTAIDFVRDPKTGKPVDTVDNQRMKNFKNRMSARYNVMKGDISKAYDRYNYNRITNNMSRTDAASNAFKRMHRGTQLAAVAGGVGAAAALGYGAYRGAKAVMGDNEKKASITVEDAYNAAYAAEALYEDCLEKMAYAEDLYADCVDYFNGDCTVKTAAVVSEADAYEAAYAAEALYEDCLEKMAYAEDLYAEADMFIKEAANYAPIAGATMGALAGATAGYMNAGRFDAPRPGVVAAGAAAGALAGAGLGYGGMAAYNRFRK